MNQKRDMSQNIFTGWVPWKPTHFGTVTPSGRPIYNQTVVSIQTYTLGDPKARRAQAVPLYQAIIRKNLFNRK